MRMMKTIAVLGFVALGVTCLPSSAHAQSLANGPSKSVECRARGGIPNALAKLRAGETVRIAYLGGSITYADPGWRAMTRDWFAARFPKARVEEIVAAICGTGSDFGAFRLADDVLSKKPDLLFVEFRVNGSGGFDYASVESIVRQTWAANPQTDICLVYTLEERMLPALSEGRQPSFGKALETICDHYGIPSIDYGPEIVRRLSEGRIVFKPAANVPAGAFVFTKDGVHPKREGHEIYRDVVVRAMETSIFPASGEAARPHALSPPYAKDGWQACSLVPSARVLAGPAWHPVDVEKDAVYGATREPKRTHGMLRGGQWTDREGMSITLRWVGSTLGFSDIPQGDTEPMVLEVSVDGGAPYEVTRARKAPHLSASFWYLPVRKWGEHTVTVTLKHLPKGQRWIVGQFLVTGTLKPQEAKVSADLRERTWRALCTTNVSFEAQEAFEGRAPAYTVRYVGCKENREGRLDLAAFAYLWLLDSWVPPYIGCRVRKVAYSVWPLESAGGCEPSLRVRVSRPHEDGWIRTQAGWWPTLRPGAWNAVEHDVALGPGQRFGDLSFLFHGGEGASCAFRLADVRLILDDGSAYEILNPDAPRYLTGMREPLRTTPLKARPTRPVLQFGLEPLWLFRHPDQIPEIAAFMERHFPEYDVVLSSGRPPEPAFLPILSTLPDNLFYEWQKGQHDLRYAALKDALVKNPKGEMQPFKLNSVVATNPVIRDALEDQIAYAGSLGLNSMLQFDYIWFNRGGIWGFDAASVAAFREDLLGADEGLRLVAHGSRPARTIHFWDYYEDYYGRRLAPSDWGLSSWADYVPRYGTRVEKDLHVALIAYEWLRQGQRFGDWTAKYCYGAPFNYLLNGEGAEIGNDHVYLSLLENTGFVSPEFFSFAPQAIRGYYRAAGRYLRTAHAAGKRFGICVEGTCGGWESQPYWSAKTGYAVCYLLSALGFDAFEYDGLTLPLGRRHWADLLEGKVPTNRWKLAMLGFADARAYRQAKRDGARKRPPTGVWHVTERAPNWTGWMSTFMEARASFRGNDFRQPLRDLALDYEMTDPQELADVLPDAKVVFAAPQIRHAGVRPMLARWLAERPGRTLVTNRADIARVAAELKLPVLQRPASGPDFADALTYDCRVGSVAVLFNRQAVQAAVREGPNGWYEKVWRPRYRKVTYDEALLLYPDKVKDAKASADVPVAGRGAYRVYRFLADAESVVMPQDGFLRLEIGDDLTDVIYYGEDTPAFRAFLAEVKSDRPLTAKFFK